jgi:hypothetical protein
MKEILNVVLVIVLVCGVTQVLQNAQTAMMNSFFLVQVVSPAIPNVYYVPLPPQVVPNVDQIDICTNHNA